MSAPVSLTTFPNAVTATALIERVVHHAEIITIEGKLPRRMTAVKQQKSRGTSSL